jgi:hypothetical protein
MQYPRSSKPLLLYGVKRGPEKIMMLELESILQLAIHLILFDLMQPASIPL